MGMSLNQSFSVETSVGKMASDKLELLKRMQESELAAIKGVHQRALQRLKDKHRNELENLAKKHKSALKITENRIVHLEQSHSTNYKK